MTTALVCSLVANLDRALQLYRRSPTTHEPPLPRPLIPRFFLHDNVNYTNMQYNAAAALHLSHTAHHSGIRWDFRLISSRLREQTRQRQPQDIALLTTTLYINSHCKRCCLHDTNLIPFEI